MNNKKNFIVIIALIIFLTFVFGAIHVITMFDVALVQEPKREYQLSGLNTTFTVNLTELKPVSSDYTPFSEYANINKKYIGHYDKYTDIIIYMHNYDIERYKYDINMKMAKSTEFQRDIMEGNLRNNIATPNDIKYNWNTYIFTNKERTNHDDLTVNLPKVSGAWVGAYTYKNDNDIDVVSIDILYQSVENDQWVICIEMPVKNYNSDKVMRIVNELIPPQKGSGV